MRHSTGFRINTLIKILSGCALGLTALGGPIASAHAQAPTVLANFHGSNGAGPLARVTINSAGEIYGTASGGGSGDEGAVWKMNEGGALSLIASFPSYRVTGTGPWGPVTFDGAGNMWGTIYEGGTAGVGTVWENKAGTTTIQTIAVFHGSNGANPQAGVSIDASGNVYGTTSYGGTAGEGVVWEIPASTINAGKPLLSVIATFHGSNGAYPQAGVTIDTSGNLYGTATQGGEYDDGVVWEIPASTLQAGKPLLSVIVTFNFANGSGPGAGVTVDSSGNLYGTTTYGGQGYGVVWSYHKQLVYNGRGFSYTYVFETLAEFNVLNGADPQGGVTIDASGNLFGTASAGGYGTNYGVVWEIPGSSISAGSPALDDIATFDNTDGSLPTGSIAVDAHGNLIGTAVLGGSVGDGVVWEVPANSVPGGVSLPVIVGP
jgi:uncharacterized repeat protein (TIGR03803 family)